MSGLTLKLKRLRFNLSQQKADARTQVCVCVYVSTLGVSIARLKKQGFDEIFGKCSARGVCMCESASEWEVEMGLPWWCLLCKIVCLFLASGASYVKT